jgi:hypothetical protein
MVASRRGTRRQFSRLHQKGWPTAGCSAIERVGYDGLSKRVLAASLLQLGLNLLQHLGGLLEGGIELGRLAVVGHGAVLVAGGEP